MCFGASKQPPNREKWLDATQRCQFSLPTEAGRLMLRDKPEVLVQTNFYGLAPLAWSCTHQHGQLGYLGYLHPPAFRKTSPHIIGYNWRTQDLRHQILSTGIQNATKMEGPGSCWTWHEESKRRSRSIPRPWSSNME